MSAALQTPGRQRLQRPSYGLNTNSAEKPLSLSVNGGMNRKPSMQGLGNMDPRTPMGTTDADFDVGDLVNVPGDMHGTVRFVGSVAGKQGTFVGVELSREFAGRGKNDGDVDGVSYFTTTVSGSGIFLPVHRAEKRYSSSISIDSPATPETPSFGALKPRTKGFTPPTPALPKFSQSIGPGARPSSPQFKAKRPSLPRPESPLRRQPPPLVPTPGKALSQSTRIGSTRPTLSSTTPSKQNLRASASQKPLPSTRPYSRNGSRLGYRDDDNSSVGVASTNNARTASIGSVPSFSHPLRPSSRLGSAGSQDADIQRLKNELAERDRRLDEQAASLAEMENSVKELSALLPADGMPAEGEDHTNAQLRQMLREKNEKIGVLTADFDAHRADFRSTLDSLEMASTETERVYEEQKRDLLNEIADMRSSKEDFEGVAQQLRQLEELVAELEEGLEESRRGEAEARSEVEFLRGEVERGRSELKREREKAAASVKDSGRGDSVSLKDIEQKDDEIRGLKAIIHSLSSNPDAVHKGQDLLAKSEELERLRADLQNSHHEKEALEKQLEQLRRDRAVPNGVSHIRTESERTATAPDSLMVMPLRSRADTVRPVISDSFRRGNDNYDHHTMPLLSNGRLDANGREGTYCEMCDSPGHDTLDCNHFQVSETTASEVGTTNGGLRSKSSTTLDDPKPNGKPVKKDGDDEKWCALCEKDGHLAFDCPEEQY